MIGNSNSSRYEDGDGKRIRPLWFAPVDAISRPCEFVRLSMMAESKKLLAAVRVTVVDDLEELAASF